MPKQIPRSKKAQPGTCIICSEACHGRHYGIEACLGCKTFFRRAVLQNQNPDCEKDGSCERGEGRKACRGCRYQMCIDAGMTKDALKPRRDLFGLGKVKLCQPKASEPGFNREESLRFVQEMTNFELKMRKRKDEWIRSRQSIIDRSEELLGVPSTSKQSTTKVTSAKCLAYTLQVDLFVMKQWVCEIPFFRSIPKADQAVILNRFSKHYIVLEHGRYTAENASEDLWLISNGTCWPRKFEMLPENARKFLSPDWRWRQEKLYTDLTEVLIDEVGNPIRRLHLSNEEMTILKLIVMFPNADIGQSEETRRRSDVFRNFAVRALFEHYQHINYPEYAVRYGNIIHLISGINEATTRLMECYQMMRLFKIVPFDTLAQIFLFQGCS